MFVISCLVFGLLCCITACGDLFCVAVFVLLAWLVAGFSMNLVIAWLRCAVWEVASFVDCLVWFVLIVLFCAL